jgi:hypothetical protein
VLLMIANHAHSDGTGAYPGMKTLAREARIDERQARRCVRELERSGELLTRQPGEQTVQESAATGGSNLYSLPGVRGGKITPLPGYQESFPQAVEELVEKPVKKVRKGGQIRHLTGVNLPPGGGGKNDVEGGVPVPPEPKEEPSVEPSGDATVGSGDGKETPPAKGAEQIKETNRLIREIAKRKELA